MPGTPSESPRLTTSPRAALPRCQPLVSNTEGEGQVLQLLRELHEQSAQARTERKALAAALEATQQEIGALRAELAAGAKQSGIAVLSRLETGVHSLLEAPLNGNDDVVSTDDEDEEYLASTLVNDPQHSPAPDGEETDTLAHKASALISTAHGAAGELKGVASVMMGAEAPAAEEADTANAVLRGLSENTSTAVRALATSTITASDLVVRLEPHRFRPRDHINAGVLDPDGSVRVAWDTLVVILLLYLAIIIPIEFAFDVTLPASLVALNIFTDLVFLLDLGLNFFTGVVIHRELVWSRGRIARRYLSTWFVLDLLSSFPSNAIPTDDRLSLVKGLRLLRMGRLTRLGRMKTVKDLERHARVPPGLVRLCKLTMTYVTFTHWLACTYHVIAVTTTTSSECAGASGNYSAATGLLTRDTWGVCPDITSQPVAVQWMSAYYWTVTAMLGEEWSPDTATRQLFSIALIITGQVLNAVVVGACASLLSNLDGRATVRQQLITDLDAFLTHHKVPYKLAGRLRSYFEHKWEWGVSVDEETLLAEVPLKLRRQLTIVSHRQLVRSSELLSALTEPQCILAIIESLEQQLMPPAEYVIIQRQRAHHLYLIQRGLVQVTQFEARDDYMREHPLRQLGPGALFGEVGLLSEAGRRTANVLTLRYCEFLTLTGEVLERLMRSFPALRELMQQRKNAMTVANRFCCWRQRTRKIRIAASSSEAAPDLADAAPALSSTGGAAPDRTRAEAPGAKAPGGAPSSTPSRRRTPRKGQSCSREDALARTLRDYVDGQPQSNTAPAPPVDTRRSRVAVSSTLDRQ